MVPRADDSPRPGFLHAERDRRLVIRDEGSQDVREHVIKTKKKFHSGGKYLFFFLLLTCMNALIETYYWCAQHYSYYDDFNILK